LASKRNKSKHEKSERKESENLVIDYLDELEIYKLESQIHQNNPNLPTLFFLMRFWNLNPKLRTPKILSKKVPRKKASK